MQFKSTIGNKQAIKWTWYHDVHARNDIKTELIIKPEYFEIQPKMHNPNCIGQFVFNLVSHKMPVIQIEHWNVEKKSLRLDFWIYAVISWGYSKSICKIFHWILSDLVEKSHQFLCASNIRRAFSYEKLRWFYFRVRLESTHLKLIRVQIK